MLSRWLLPIVLVASVLHGFCAAAQSTHCTGALGDVEVRGNLNITARCQLTGTAVRGNVTLFSGGSLIARDASIRGNLTAERADFIAIEGSVIDGSVALEELVGDSSGIESTEIRGNVTLTNNGSSFEVLNNEIGGNLKASGNTGGLSISGNSIDGNLECSGNSPAPSGLGNGVGKRSQGQCQNLLPQDSSPSSPPPATSPPSATPAPAAPPPPVRDTTPPTLTLRGASTVNLKIDSPYTDAGATATDSVDGDLTSRIAVVNPVNTALLGTFTITYSVSDSSGNAATPVTRTVIVAPQPAEGGGGGGAVGWPFALLLVPLLVGPYRARVADHAALSHAQDPARRSGGHSFRSTRKLLARARARLLIATTEHRAYRRFPAGATGTAHYR